MTTLWVNGSLVDPDAPSISALDHGLTVGDGVFETLKVVDGQPFALTRHLDRLERSAAGLGLPKPGRSEVVHACTEVAAAIDATTVHRLRITYTAGNGPLGSDRTDATPTLTVASSPAPVWAPQAAVAVAPWPRNERSPLVGLKTTSYADNVVALAWARARGAGEAVFVNTAGLLCEGTGSNVFVVVDQQVLTPPLSSGCLGGITRELVLEWSDATEADLAGDVLSSATEVFLTSSTRDVQPVSRVDQRDLAVGERTRQIAAEFVRRSALDVDP
jgi:branched-chain amino acid aminotransferase